MSMEIVGISGQIKKDDTMRNSEKWRVLCLDVGW